MSFLEEARKIQGDYTQTAKKAKALAIHCWSELLAVVDRMHFEHDHHPEETDGVPCKGCDALKTLDAKAYEK